MAVQVRVDPSTADRVRDGMPDMPLDCTLRARRRTGKVLGVLGPFDTKGQLVVDGLVRLLDKSILEYRAAREELLSFFPDGYINRYHRAQDHFESFVQSLHRAITYLDRLRALGFTHPNGVPVVPRPRELEVLRDDVKANVRKFRDNLEHLDRDILGLKLERADDVGPSLGTHAATIADATIVYADAVRWCSQIHDLAVPMSTVVLKALPDSTTVKAGGDA